MDAQVQQMPNNSAWFKQKIISTGNCFLIILPTNFTNYWIELGKMKIIFRTKCHSFNFLIAKSLAYQASLNKLLGLTLKSRNVIPFSISAVHCNLKYIYLNEQNYSNSLRFFHKRVSCQNNKGVRLESSEVTHCSQKSLLAVTDTQKVVKLVSFFLFTFI